MNNFNSSSRNHINHNQIGYSFDSHISNNYLKLNLYSVLPANLRTRGVYFWRCLVMFINLSTPPASSNDRENSAFFLMTSFNVASTAAIVSSLVPWSCWLFPDGSFWMRSLIAYLPINSLLRWSIAKFLSAVATAHTTRSTWPQKLFISDKFQLILGVPPGQIYYYYFE